VPGRAYNFRPERRAPIRQWLIIGVACAAAVAMAFAPGIAAGGRVGPPPASTTSGIPSGAVPTAHVVNVYWDAHWDDDVRSAHLDPAVFGHDAIDGFVRAVIGGTYLAGLAQYGVRSVEFDGSVLASEECGAFAPRDVPGGMPQRFAGCMADSEVLRAPVDANLVVNLLIPVTTATIPNKGFAYHSWRCCAPKTPFAFTVVPLIYAVTRSPLLPGPSLGAMLTHELVEALTNPFGKFGWFDLRTGSEGEIADLCEWRAARPAAPAQAFQAWAVTQYWSNDANGCVP